MNGFLKQYGIDKDMDIKEKYNSKAAEVSSMHGCQHSNIGCLFHVKHALKCLIWIRIWIRILISDEWLLLCMTDLP